MRWRRFSPCSIWNRSRRDIFRGLSPQGRIQRVFGGQVLGQALVAATRTVDVSRICHSLHAYFLRPGDPRVPILYEVDRSRDGNSFSARRVVAIQHGKQIFNFAASFQTPNRAMSISSGCQRCRRRKTLEDATEVRRGMPNNCRNACANG